MSDSFGASVGQNVYEISLLENILLNVKSKISVIYVQHVLFARAESDAEKLFLTNTPKC